MAQTIKLILVRGLPGSGKSTLAKEIQSTSENIKWVETDMFFTHQGTAKYKFEHSKVKRAHEWCLYKTEQYLRDGFSVVVSNTFVQLWEMQLFIDMAKKFDADVQVSECIGEFQNTHGVSDDTMQQMRELWEPYAVA